MNIHAFELFSHLPIRYGTTTLTFDVSQKCRRPHLSWNVETEIGNFSTATSTITVRCDYLFCHWIFTVVWTDTVRTLVRLRSREHVPLLSYVLVRFLRPATPRHVQPSQNPDSYWRNIAQFPFAPAHLRARVHEFTCNRTRASLYAYHEDRNALFSKYSHTSLQKFFVTHSLPKHSPLSSSRNL